ncbi:MAG TPA: HD domain-containing protein, partial [Leucothrix sp.]|nr:HD domain-containing protein [Leucothrix sp.]
RNMRRLSTDRGAEELPFCAELFKTLKQPLVLYLSGLFHDIAKGRGGSHSELGAVDALEFCLSHGLSKNTSETVSDLVHQHLILSSTAQRKDISDPDVIKEVADLVKTLEHLKLLYLLTICDIRGTNPTLLNNWKHSLLKNLYHNTRRYLENNQTDANPSADTFSDLIKEKQHFIEQQEIDQEKYIAFSKRFNENYILQYPVEELLWHFDEISKQPNETIVKLYKSDNKDSSNLFIYAKDQDSFFIKITSAIEQRNLDIVAANIESSKDGYALNTFYLLAQEGSLLDNEEDIKSLIDTIKTNLSQENCAYDFKQQYLSRQHKHFEVNTKVSFEQDNTKQHSLITIRTADKAGLLTHIARIFNDQNLALHNAKITTLGEIAEDTFEVTTKSGKPIVDKGRLDQIEKAILEALG